MNITPYFNKLEYLNETANQIIKDFDMLGLDIKFSGNADNAYNELLYQIIPHITKLMESNYQKLLDLLYRIDIPEGKISQCMNDSSGAGASETIAELIIKRELQKIVIRKHYKHENDGYYEN